MQESKLRAEEVQRYRRNNLDDLKEVLRELPLFFANKGVIKEIRAQVERLEGEYKVHEARLRLQLLGDALHMRGQYTCRKNARDRAFMTSYSRSVNQRREEVRSLLVFLRDEAGPCPSAEYKASLDLVIGDEPITERDVRNLLSFS